MDLKSMLNDSAAQRPPRLHTPQASYDSRAVEKISTSETRSQSQTSRAVPYAPPLQPVDGANRHSTGGYFGFQSPHQGHPSSASTHVSTSSAGIYAKSPGAQSQVFTPQEITGSVGAPNTPFVPSPSPSINQPPTPGSAYHYPNHTPVSAQPQSGHPSSFIQPQSPRASRPTNGQPRQISPHQHNQYPQVVTPLGPPSTYNKISPQAQRPPSQGLEYHTRKSSYGSVGSVPSRETSLSYPVQQPDLVRSESTHRQSIPDLERVRERDRSVSVSPKTIPQPSPYRHTSLSSQPSSQGRLTAQSPPQEGHARVKSVPSEIPVGGMPGTTEVKSESRQTPTPQLSSIPQTDHPPLSQGSLVKQEKTEMTSSPTPSARPPLSRKRNASEISDQSHTAQQNPHKRLRRGDVPIFAQSIRKKPLTLQAGGSKAQSVKTVNTSVPPPNLQQSVPSRPHANKTTPGPVTNGQTSDPAPIPSKSNDVRWECSIANISPYEDLTRRVADWIFVQIGNAVPPAGGAMFEIEAKIGEIFDIDHGRRIDLPIETEAIFSKDKYHNRTKFESSMKLEQHMLLNKYLNEITAEAFVQAQKGERQEIVYDHPHEVDEFFELTPEGRENLNPSIRQYQSQRLTPRVRRTRDRNTGQVKAQIIKSRIADLEIYNPGTDFDCRISISIESPWEGSNNWLLPMGHGNEGRHKDRMSYRHMAYQIDLTQVSHDNQSHMEHELEVEISTEQIRRELDNLQNGRESKYEDLVRGLIDNVRLLCRKGSTGHRA